jgi:hypothetical protein
MSKRLEAIEKMIAAGSQDPFRHYARAMELRSLDRKAEALGALGEVTERFPTYVPSYLMAAQLAAELGQKDDAARFADRGIDAARAAGDAHALSELTTFKQTLA